MILELSRWSARGGGWGSRPGPPPPHCMCFGAPGSIDIHGLERGLCDDVLAIFEVWVGCSSQASLASALQECRDRLVCPRHLPRQLSQSIHCSAQCGCQRRAARTRLVSWMTRYDRCPSFNSLIGSFWQKIGLPDHC